MTASSPADLAIVYRSLPRRRREAQSSADSARAAGGRVVSGTGGTAGLRIDAVLLTAAGLLGCDVDPVAIADAIDHVRPKDWDTAVLESLRNGALEIGRALRDLATGA